MLLQQLLLLSAGKTMTLSSRVLLASAAVLGGSGGQTSRFIQGIAGVTIWARGAISYISSKYTYQVPLTPPQVQVVMTMDGGRPEGLVVLILVLAVVVAVAALLLT